MITFNIPHITGLEITNIHQAIERGHISGNGYFTKKCHHFFEERYGFKKVLLTTSCTDALEMAAILCGIETGDEVIVPSYTFVSSALAFVREGAVIKFIDSRSDHPGMDEDKLETLITPKTKAIVCVHYAGVACDMDKIMAIADKHNLFVIEDAAQAIDSYYKGRPLGSIGHLGCFSFHETKNIQCGEGGLLIINDDRFLSRAEIIWEKGTNRAEFFRGEINKYGWVDTGSSFLPSEITAAFLLGQLDYINQIQTTRTSIWNNYYNGLKPVADLGYFKIPNLPDYAMNNAHMFYIICEKQSTRVNLIDYLKKNNILAVFHYQSLHKSRYYAKKTDTMELINSDKYSDCLVRLPLHSRLSKSEIDFICECIKIFFTRQA